MTSTHQLQLTACAALLVSSAAAGAEIERARSRPKICSQSGESNFSTAQTRADLPQGNFVAIVNTLRVNYGFSPFLTLSNLFQYDNASRNLGWQSRVRWTLRPGNDVFFVFSRGWLEDPEDHLRFSLVESKLSAKFQYTFRL